MMTRFGYSISIQTSHDDHHLSASRTRGSATVPILKAMHPSAERTA